LGLAATLGIVRGHKGVIKVNSEVGKGTIFKILLPAVSSMAGKRDNNVEYALSLKSNSVILIIDDDPCVLDVSSEMLTKLGFRVLKANNGQEGLNIFRKHEKEIACVLLDLTMPEMSGEETFLELRKLQNDVRVILSSGYNEQDVTQRFDGRDLAGFIQKPYTVAGLRNIMKNVLNL
jgi:CheY-like chemotaxis protein